jgi:NTP pyrophosphatase (non-canonical NTP hydrolase)
MSAQDILREHIRQHLHWGPLGGADRMRFMTLALCGEAGELANLVKKDWRGDKGIPDRRAKMIEELADVGNYAFMIAEILGIDLQKEMLAKLLAVEQRPEWKRAAVNP